ncbi:septum site-determining protein MinC [Helicovermis profundi]|uniref:Probable septum site-determining protein MinC n=1 Tax=Helicovermis profundi TaxID=3065157 RepID=A0AAU9E747_9FIRM|nr:septum site-determining protein MinC [Clostridia bacterium S502]
MLNLSHLEFKGNKDGIVIHISKESSIKEMVDSLSKKIEKKSFYKGAFVVGTSGKKLTYNEKSIIEEILIKELEINVKSLENIDSFTKKTNKVNNKNSSENDVFDGIKEGLTKFVRGTLRSGVKVDFKGNVIILGDVNPGAEVIAYGNIIIMGTLRGVAYAGANGNINAYVVANKLIATQLRIAGLITRAPDDGDYEPDMPEIAYIKENRMEIEPYI